MSYKVEVLNPTVRGPCVHVNTILWVTIVKCVDKISTSISGNRLIIVILRYFFLSLFLLERCNKANECKEPTNLGTRSGDIRIGLAEACQCNGHSDRCS